MGAGAGTQSGEPEAEAEARDTVSSLEGQRRQPRGAKSPASAEGKLKRSSSEGSTGAPSEASRKGKLNRSSSGETLQIDTGKRGIYDSGFERAGIEPPKRYPHHGHSSLESRADAGSTLSATPLPGKITWNGGKAAFDAALIGIEGAKLASAATACDAVGGGYEVAVVAVGAFQWLREHALPVYHSILRWWGGEEAWKRVYEDYVDARREIINQNKVNDIRLKLLQDLRKKFRTEKPQWADKFN
jgi:hypothetical protein